MMSPAERKAAQRDRQREQGLQQLEAWVHPDAAAAVRRYIAKKNAECAALPYAAFKRARR